MNENRFDVKPSNTLEGRILIASSKLFGTRFEKTVLLLLQHNYEGTFGVVLNRPANQSIKDAWRQITGSPEKAIAHLAQGGPMGGPVFALHPMESLGEIQVPGGIFLSATAETIGQVVRSGIDRYRIFMGIAGWQPEQLEEEIDQGCWYLMPGDIDTVFDRGDGLWERSILRFGEFQMSEILGVSSIQGDCHLN